MLAAAVFFVGTGGFATPQALNLPTASGIVRIAHELGQHSTPGQHVLDTQEKLAGIRRYLSLNVSNMAKVFRVGRPTVYSWLRDDPVLRANHAQRIDELYVLARSWRNLSIQPIGDLISRPLASGESVLDLLSAKSIDAAAIQNAFVEIAGTVNRKARRTSVVEIAKRSGFKLAPSRPITNWSSSDEVDI